ncbi:MAG TPA: ABC transporter ATP-binding protein [Oscillospiraceae bacterium]|nr:ABC transporter ATP-binding protein [Oscillospiraceae bacterium]HPS35860.1 ABC transporter ATP-binding protein [Oscillospiraceae bacterium]
MPENEKKKKIKPAYSVLRNMGFLLKNLWAADKFTVLSLPIAMACAVALRYAWIYLPKFVIDQVTNGSSVGQIALATGIFVVACIVIESINGYFSGNAGNRFMKVTVNFQHRIFKKTLNCDYALLEGSEGQTKYQKAKSCEGDSFNDRANSTSMIWNFFQTTQNVLMFILFTTVLSVVNPLIVVLVLVGSGAELLARLAFEKWVEKQKDRWAKTDKRQNYVIKTSSDSKSGKDIRIYKMSKWFADLREMLLKEQIKNRRERNFKELVSDIPYLLNTFLRDALAYAYLAWKASIGEISVGDLILYFNAITLFSTQMQNVVGWIHEINLSNYKICDLRSYLDMPDRPDPVNPTDVTSLSRPLTIEFCGVCFSYPGSEKLILDHLSMQIRGGEKIALVGVNGAGKTTIVKLLCGFYQPTKGKILIGGQDIANMRREDIFSLLSAVFQDISLLPVTVAQNVAMKKPEDVDYALVKDCLERAGIWEHVSQLPQAENTQLLRFIHDDGVMLSGGEQQKLLLARSLYKQAPVLILDEPTAALDPISESEVYDKYQELAGSSTVLFISHRLASTRFCDRIFFLENGAITERGSHAELMTAGGKYAGMFEIQSHYYKENVTPNGNLALEGGAV